MRSNRRTFLKTTATGLASSAATLVPDAVAAAQATKAPPVVFEMPRNVTLVNMRTAAGPRLGVKQARGVLDVAAAAALYKLAAPVDTDDLLQHGKGGLLARVVAAAAKGPARLYLQESRGPAVGARTKIVEMSRVVVKHAIDITRKAHTHGLLRPIRPEVSALSVVGAVERLLLAVLTEEDVGNPLEIPDALTTIILDGLRRP